MNKSDFTSYKVIDVDQYRFMFDAKMQLDFPVMHQLSLDLRKILSDDQLSSDEDARIKSLVLASLDWVADVGVHTGLCIRECNCIVIMKDGRQYKFIKLFRKRIEDLYVELQAELQNNDDFIKMYE